MKKRLMAAAKWAGGRFLVLEEKPLAVILVAAGATVGVAFALASAAGWPRVLHLVYARHSWSWLAVCLVGELAAYFGYVLTIHDMARVDSGAEMNLAVSTTTVVAGFGVFAATRSSGGFAVDYWAFRRAGASRREAVRRVFALGVLEYAMLSTVALIASAALYLGLDGHASDAATLPSLLIVPALRCLRALGDLAKARRPAQEDTAQWRLVQDDLRERGRRGRERAQPDYEPAQA